MVLTTALVVIRNLIFIVLVAYNLCLGSRIGGELHIKIEMVIEGFAVNVILFCMLNCITEYLALKGIIFF